MILQVHVNYLVIQSIRDLFGMVKKNVTRTQGVKSDLQRLGIIQGHAPIHEGNTPSTHGIPRPAHGPGIEKISAAPMAQEVISRNFTSCLRHELPHGSGGKKLSTTNRSPLEELGSGGYGGFFLRIGIPWDPSPFCTTILEIYSWNFFQASFANP